jgi:RimJ/RimL family protein N-acetyltransferase
MVGDELRLQAGGGFMTRRIVIGNEVVQWVAKRTGEFGNYGAAVGFGIEDDRELIAGVVFNEYNGANINMHVASDGSRKWMTREFLWMVFDYAFNQAKIKRITGLVGEGNTEAQLFDEHIGFSLETTLSDAHPSGDLLVYVMRREQCRWLNIRRSHHELQQAA